VPRDKGPLELAALTAALLLAFELSLTHWSYLYLPWVLPFVLLALMLPRTPRIDARAP
jgi:alkanesulfonate monooxygenase SsuD/methylene tetrahydromethanopterin reductase-like flavin-dependent oxidoreductase (luciferase family)